ncbi:peptide deformylase [Furfurilactobacillus rossiae]|uniref:Peptide deformylase n=1 Tax=Furfurilactobacillus rossiae DSM 15814 TaxID=1114972 RepID=A0A0R1RJ48_9LACO|nr:peptide deformylase [Furfurilactobacillus rossiae]KRL53699.1 peptide deformylase [Furfurilactobacillus rossiae DSM 15814]QFR67692.1 peptide deformylase [Furfurilactobacillus rossiae]QLE60657.1 Peptide deformylase [Furfurilactobacillus rossiae]
MIQPINTDIATLKRPAMPATKTDQQIVTDLLDTLKAHQDNCVGMAANMIGRPKRIIVYQLGPMQIPMINPVITTQSAPYQTTEGCLSLPGQRPTKRYHNITVRYQTSDWQTKTASFTDFTAQIIQHEIDHCDGILI